MAQRRVLIVEDDESIRETLRLALEFNGCDVFTAENGRKGVDLLHRIARPCLILLDLMMPVMNGWGFVDTVGQDPALASIPIVVVTAYGEGAKPIKAREIISKPIELDAFFNVVSRYCDNAAN